RGESQRPVAVAGRHVELRHLGRRGGLAPGRKAVSDPDRADDRDVVGAGEQRSRAVRWRRRVQRLRGAIPSWLADAVWPSIRPLTPDEERAEKRKREERRADDLARVEAMNGLSLEELDAGVDECRALFETEQGRGQSVEARLTSIIGLASVAAAV